MPPAADQCPDPDVICYQQLCIGHRAKSVVYCSVFVLLYAPIYSRSEETFTRNVFADHSRRVEKQDMWIWLEPGALWPIGESHLRCCIRPTLLSPYFTQRCTSQSCSPLPSVRPTVLNPTSSVFVGWCKSAYVGRHVTFASIV